ncbi:MAG: glycogen/starch synthase [Flavobacteriales bacterium]|jgi:starch synthase|uniref:glycogen/starch synthase n=1 Tax=Blattabacterium sp. (Mastotermes darwiniensis) TaxID=39768 RepID=UPI000231DE41|nr:glycogen/starch synthase [Blattabacterium sp. (Mastotermes darwiniensis)]AER40629.1 glycogen synthase-related protein [Blattabacterium sp. (Mastotermes darwiniensis) str. MADAR]MDR1804740.1 glycogen/starch synthase [Flavobacteriales bacterium]
MTGKRILYVSSDLFPFSSENPISLSVLKATKFMQSIGNDIRIFMPRFGVINERRHQLHEVIRLSGMNLIINEMDRPLLIKVASIPDARLQVYFIDNEEYFKRKAIYEDKNGNFFSDNDERALFFTKGVLESVRKLNWRPDIIHIYGWITTFIPLYIKEFYKNDPVYHNTKIVTSIYNKPFQGTLNKDILQKIKLDGIKSIKLKLLENPDYFNLIKFCMYFSDAIIKGDLSFPKEIEDYIEKNKLLVLKYYPVDKIETVYQQFYQETVSEQIN